MHSDDPRASLSKVFVLFGGGLYLHNVYFVFDLISQVGSAETPAFANNSKFTLVEHEDGKFIMVAMAIRGQIIND